MEASLTHLLKSRLIHKQFRDDCCAPAADRLRYIIAILLARFMIDSKAPEDSLIYGDEALQAARTWHTQSPTDSNAKRALALAESTAGVVYLDRKRRTEVVGLLREADQLFEELTKQFPGDDDLSFQMVRFRKTGWRISKADLSHRRSG